LAVNDGKRKSRRVIPPATTTEPAGIGDAVAHGERPAAVFEHLRASIVRGLLAPGTPLMEAEIAGRLGVSRTPVRGALQRLHQEGLIVQTTTPRPFKFTVAPLTRGDAQAIYRIVAELDGLAACDAAAASPADRRRLVQTLRALNDDLRAEAESGRRERSRLYELDHLFHHRYITLGASPRLLALHAAINPQVERYARVYVMLLTDEIHKSVLEHAAIIRALARGDRDAAQSAARTNWRNAAERLAFAIDRMGEWGTW